MLRGSEENDLAANEVRIHVKDKLGILFLLGAENCMSKPVFLDD